MVQPTLHRISTDFVLGESMNPYYEHAGITIYHGDCREILPQVNADCCITDPPYGVSLGVKANNQRFDRQDVLQF